jgi:hypothetical protein
MNPRVRIADPSSDILAASEAAIVTRIEDRRQELALLTLAPGAAPSEWLKMLAALAIDEAALLPSLGETGDSVKRFRVAPRLTAHVRHRATYTGVLVRPDEGFVFARKGRPTGRRARTIRDLLASLPLLPDDVVQGHLARGDFRRWIEDVFGGRELGATILDLGRGDVAAARDAFRRIIAERYSGSPT